MKRLASEVIRELENRIARLERQAGASSELNIILEKVLNAIKMKGGHGPMTKAGVDTYTVYMGTQTNELPQDRDVDVSKDISLETYNYASVYLDEATTSSICSRIKNKDRTLVDELNKFFRNGSNSSKIISALEKRGAKKYVARKLEEAAEYRNENSYDDEGYIMVQGFWKASISQPSASYEIVAGRCLLHVKCTVKNTAIMAYVLNDDDDDYDF